MSNPDWKCPHGVGRPARPGDCEACNADIQNRPSRDTMTGDDRAEEVRSLLNDPTSFRFDDVHSTPTEALKNLARALTEKLASQTGDSR